MASVSTSEANRSSARIPELDGVRGIAILLVLIWHYMVIHLDLGIPLLSRAMRFLGTTWSGVDLFFVLSGLLIGGILLDNREATNYFKVFYIRRFLRIVPVYFAWLLLFIICAPILINSDLLSKLVAQPLPLWSYFTFTQNFVMASHEWFGPEWLGITWSLAVEEQFYLTLPLTIWLIPRKYLPWVVAALIPTAFVLRRLYLAVFWKSLALYVLMPFRADALFLGVLGAIILRHPKLRDIVSAQIRVLYIAFGILLAASLWMSFRYPGDVTSSVVSIYGYTLFAVTYFLFIMIALTETKGVVKSLTRLRFLRFLGLHAYGIYLFHQTVNLLMHGLILKKAPTIASLPDAAVTLLAFGITLLLARVSWLYFEKPLVIQGHQHKYKFPESTESVSAQNSPEVSVVASSSQK